MKKMFLVLSFFSLSCLYSAEYKVTFMNIGKCTEAIVLYAQNNSPLPNNFPLPSFESIYILKDKKKIITVSKDEDLYIGRTERGPTYAIYPKGMDRPSGDECCKREDQIILLGGEIEY